MASNNGSEAVMYGHGLRRMESGFAAWDKEHGEYPRNWSTTRKSYDMTMIAFFQFYATLVSTTGPSAATYAMEELRLSRTLAIAVFTITYCYAKPTVTTARKTDLTDTLLDISLVSLSVACWYHRSQSHLDGERCTFVLAPCSVWGISSLLSSHILQSLQLLLVDLSVVWYLQFLRWLLLEALTTYSKTVDVFALS
jgi:hypothetical protein